MATTTTLVGSTIRRQRSGYGNTVKFDHIGPHEVIVAGWAKAGSHREQEYGVRNLQWSAGWVLAIGVMSLAGALPAHAEPLTPLSSAELTFLEQLHRVYAVSPDPIAFRSDGVLLTLGRSACTRRDEHQLVGQGASFVSPAIAQLAFIYLCPQ